MMAITHIDDYLNSFRTPLEPEEMKQKGLYDNSFITAPTFEDFFDQQQYLDEFYLENDEPKVRAFPNADQQRRDGLVTFQYKGKLSGEKNSLTIGLDDDVLEKITDHHYYNMVCLHQTDRDEDNILRLVPALKKFAKRAKDREVEFYLPKAAGLDNLVGYVPSA